jgi:predicted ATPase
LDELPLPQQDILKRAAVIGNSFEKPALHRLCKKRLTEREAEVALERVVQAGFLSEVQSDLYKFNHPLMQEAIYATLSFSQRQIWHTDIGNWLIDRQLEQNLELIAYHHLRGDDAAKAAKYALQAASKARENGAYDGAADYYQQVLALEDAPQAQKMIAAENGGDMLAVQQQVDSAQGLYQQAVDLGSANAAQKLAILSGSLEQIAQTEFSPAFRAWAEGSRAWLLAQNGEVHPALDAAQTALNLTDDSAEKAIEKLLKTLKRGETVGSYEGWLQQFGQAVLLIPPTERVGVVER